MRIRGNLVQRDWHFEPDTESRMVDAAIHALLSSGEDDAPTKLLAPQCKNGHTLDGSNRRNAHRQCPACHRASEAKSRAAKPPSRPRRVEIAFGRTKTELTRRYCKRGVAALISGDMAFAEKHQFDGMKRGKRSCSTCIRARMAGTSEKLCA